MSALITGRVLDSGNIVTPKGRILYPTLFKPRAMKGEPDEKAAYGATLLLPKTADLTILRKAFQDARDEAFSAKVRQTVKIKEPILKTEDQPRFAEHADEYPWMIRFRRGRDLGAPDVVTPKGDRKYTEDEEADEVYGGRWARITCRPYTYDRTDSKGVSFGLQNVQMLDHAEPLAGGKARGTDEFDAVSVDADEEFA